MSSTDPVWIWQWEKTIASSSDEGHAAIEILNQALQEHGWEGRDFFHIHMATEEAVINAIEHGNKRDLSKNVHLFFRISTDQVKLQITDQGPGFDYNDLPDPTDDDRIDMPRGRGVMLIRNMMTQVLYNDKGNSLTMIKHRSPEVADDE